MRPDLNETMTVAEALAWVEDVFDRVDAPGWYGQVYSTCDIPMSDAPANQGLNAETVIRTQSGEDAACAGEGRCDHSIIGILKAGDTLTEDKVMAMWSRYLFSACPVVFGNENYGMVPGNVKRHPDYLKAMSKKTFDLTYSQNPWDDHDPGAILSERYEDLIDKD